MTTHVASLDGILLGLLRAPRTGYEIKQAFDTIFTHIWVAELSQIYRTLKRLEAEGCLRSRAEPSDKGPERRKYSITPKGRKRLETWLRSGPHVADERHAHVAQLFFLGELHDFAVTEAFIEQLLAGYRRRLAAMQGMESSWRAADPAYPDRLEPEAFHTALALQMGIRRIEALAQWAEASLGRVRKRRSTEK